MEISEDILKKIKEVSKTIREQKSMSQKGSQQWSFDAQFDPAGMSDHLPDFSIKIFARQNESDETNFSCGISLVGKEIGKIMLARYNGSNHENDVASYECHIHRATVESINRGDRHPEHADTQTTDRYENLDEAFKCLREDYNISMNAGSLQKNLFEDLLL